MLNSSIVFLGRKRPPSNGGNDDDDEVGVQATPHKQAPPPRPPSPPVARPTMAPTTGSNVASTSGGPGTNLGAVMPIATDPMSASAVRTPILAPVVITFYSKSTLSSRFSFDV